MERRTVRTRGAAAAIALVLSAGIALPAAQKKTVVPPGKSPELAKQLGAILDAQKLTNFAAPDPATPNRYVSVLYTPGVEIMMAAAVFDGTDIDYYIYQKDFSSAFNQLRVSPTAKDRLLVEDISADGLVPQPAKDAVPDVVTTGTEKKTFDGNFSDPHVVNRSKPSFDDYTKWFNDLDAKYAQALGVLIAALKK